MVNTIPCEVFSLSEFVCEEMDARGWTTSDIALRMDNGQSFTRNLLTINITLVLSPMNRGCLIGDEMFAGLSNAFHISEKFFRSIHAIWEHNPDKRSAFEPSDCLLDGDFCID